MVTETGARASDVVRAFRIARDVTGSIERWADIEALDGLIDPGVQNELLSGVDWLVETTSRWYLVRADRATAVGGGRTRRGSRSRSSRDVIDQIGSEAWREEHEHAARRLVAEGVPPAIARSGMPSSRELVHGPDIIAVAHATGRSVLEVARGFFLLGERLEIDWLETAAGGSMSAGTRWQRWAQQSMEDDLFNLRRQLAEKALGRCGPLPIDEAVEKFLESRADAVERLQRFMSELAVDGVTDLAPLTVALRQIRALVG